jgi:hypothetical protein
MKYIFFLLLFVSLTSKTMANHTTQAHFEYTFLSKQSDSSTRYKIILVYDRDCNSGSVVFADKMKLGVYYEGSGSLYTSMSIDISSRTKIATCYGQCQEEAIYEGYITLPAYNGNFLLVQEMCCRAMNTNVADDQNGMPYQGTSAFCSIPGMGRNSSAKVTQRGLIYTDPAQIDTLTFPLVDPDGDSIVVRLSQPHAGASLNENFPEPSSSFKPLKGLDYKSAYSAQFPFGNGSVFKIEKNQLIVQCGLQGNYAVAFDILEYRKGVQISALTWEIVVCVTTGIPLSDKLVLHAWGEKGPRAVLQWSNCSWGINSQVIERSSDGNSFTSIANIPAYVGAHVDDDVSWNSTYYYRIKSVGSSTVNYSNVDTVRFWNTGIDKNNIAEHITLSPVPVSGICQVKSGKEDIIACNVLDQMGRNIHFIPFETGQKTFDIDCSFLIPGIYTVQLKTVNGMLVNKRIVKL